MSARLIEVIETSLELRGAGVVGDPKRRVVQYYNKGGVLLAERDPFAEEIQRKRVEAMEAELKKTREAAHANEEGLCYWRKMSDQRQGVIEQQNQELARLTKSLHRARRRPR